MTRINGFNLVARVYDKLVSIVFGKTLMQAQQQYINTIPPHSRVIILGGGTGEIAEKILAINPSCSICYVEASSEMLALSQKRLRQFPNVEYIHGTEHDVSGMFDVVVSNFYLDLFTEQSLHRIIEQIKRFKKINGLWLVTDFITPTKRYQKVLLYVMYRFFRITSNVEATRLTDWTALLRQHGIKEKDSTLFANGFVKTSLFQ